MAKFGAAILTIVGTVVGAYLGGPFGASLGASLGALAGGLLFPPQAANSVGPRLADITSTTSAVGLAIPRGWGTFPAAGNFIALSDIREVMVTTSQGGKGAPQSTTTTPTYYQDFAIGLNDSGPPEVPRPIAGVRTMWANGIAVYDRRPQAATETTAAYQARMAASDQLEGSFTLYLGTEDQLADPTLEAFYGVGNISAFRGLAYIVFANWQCKSEDGNRIPSSWTFELYQDGDDTSIDSSEYSNDILLPWVLGDPPVNACAVYTYVALWPNFLSGGSLSGGPTRASLEAALADIPANFSQGGGNQYIDYAPYNDKTGGTDTFPTSSVGGDTVTEVAWREVTVVYLHFNKVVPKVFLTASATSTCVATNANVGKSIRQALGDRWDHYSQNGVVYQSTGVPQIDNPSSAIFGPEGWDTIVSCGGSGSDFFESYDTLVQVTRAPQPPFPYYLKGDPAAPQCSTFCDPIPGLDNWGTLNGALVSLGGWTQYTAPSGKHCLVLQAYAMATVSIGAHEPYNIVTAYPLNPALPDFDSRYNEDSYWQTAYADAVITGAIAANKAYVRGGSLTNSAGEYPHRQASIWEKTHTLTSTTTMEANAAIIASDICLEAGYTIADVDVSELADLTVAGFVRTGVMAARNALSPLAQACFFDVVESNYTLKFVVRGQPNTFAYTLDQLGAQLAGSSDAAPRITTVKALDTDLPRRVTITYLSPSRDYQQGTAQSPVRVQTKAVNEVNIQLPMVLDDDRAAVIATSLWAQTWAERWTHTTSVSGREQGLQVADCGTLPIDGLNVRVRITQIADSFPATRALTCVRDDDAAYTPTAVASASTYVTSPIKLITPVTAFVLDLPALVDTDSDPGFYCAFTANLAGNFRGAQLYQSTDNGASYSKDGEVSNEATVGAVVQALGVSDYDCVDHASVLYVRLSTGEFESCTFDALLSGSNAIALGADGRWEVCQFMTAALVVNNIWMLTDLLRGRRGTEQFIGTGVVGDAVVLLSGPGVGRAALAITGVGRDYLYRALGTGVSIDQAENFDFTGHGTALKPFSVCRPTSSRDGSGNITLNWIRRGRIGDTLQSGIDVPVSEDYEAYEVDVLSAPSGTVLRTISSNVQTAPFSAADQITYFGALQAALNVVIYQVSAQVSRGYGTAVTL